MKVPWMLIVVLATVSACGVTPARSDHARPPRAPAATSVTVYEPWEASGLASGVVAIKHVRGYCWIGAFRSGRQDAWRCLAGNGIEDPCFANPYQAPVSTGACPTRTPTRVLVLSLTQPLPLRSANSGRSVGPWLYQLGDGAQCEAITGTTVSIAGMTAWAACSNGATLVGAIHHAREWWVLAQSGHSAFLGRAEIRRVWK